MPPWIRRRPKTALSLLIIIMAALAVGWHWGLASTPAVQWRTDPVTRGDVEEVVTALGTLEPQDYVDVGAQVSGQLTELYVDVGDSVEQGQLLAEIDASVQKSRVEAGQAELEALRAQREQRQAELELARQQYQRQQRLLDADATSDDAYQTARASFAVTQAQIAVLQAQIRQKEASVEGDRTTLGYARIYAPRAGTIVSLEAREGQTLNANQTTPTLMRIADLSTMTVSTQVSEADVDRLAPGMPVYFHTLGNDQVRYDSTLRQVLPTPEVVNNVVLYTAEFDVDNDDGRLMSGMTAQAFFVVQSAEDALSVPVAAVERTASGQAQVRVLDEQGRSQTREVTVGFDNRVRAVILDGLAEGDRVILGPTTGQATEGGSSGRRRGLL
ncbi:efflux RND transporter periplasmic adaptor subunit [Halomonas elongata]|uniref:efflux RND transporter periplasmic adaptor subunit n=1 Tax=Halomonas elongata TaxID=2746 RepID=UPI002E2CFF89|nr:efflux RND transporter periplasmic adaptor subunit [Halomonas elongata]WVI71466.1 efflux RND transporter periplasmic adaptor subunit [Halomonas elongata]